jgi:SAM-dependent methyltransferase
MIAGKGGEPVEEHGRTTAGERSRARPPTSHERSSGRPWDASYLDGPAPWDLGRPQPAVVRLAARGGVRGPVLDAGCGTGENALHLAALGLPVLGVDVAATALRLARQHAAERGIAAEFREADALHLEGLGRRFATVLDCGLFHTFDAVERPAYLASLASVTAPGATLHVLSFRDAGPGSGPHPVRRDELAAAFSAGTGWELAAVEAERIGTRFSDDDGVPAWLATARRVPAGDDGVREERRPGAEPGGPSPWRDLRGRRAGPLPCPPCS